MNIFKSDTPSGHVERPDVMQSKQCDDDRFWTDARLPGSRKYPMDVVSVERPQRGHHY